MLFDWPAEEAREEILKIGSDNIRIMTEKYGALSQNKDNIYSRICLVNSCISLEPFRGCPLDCVYCAANNDVRSLNTYANERSNLKIRTPELLFKPRDLIDALLLHPAFIPDKSIISFCSGSTEVFHPLVEDEIWLGLKYLAELGLKNPIWLVVKSFLSGNKRAWEQRFQYLSKHGIKVIISISDAGLSKDYEPFQIENRFEPFKEFTDSGVFLSHHLRPLLMYDGVYEGIKTSLLKSESVVSSICFGGLRLDPVMYYYWHGKAKETIPPGNQTKFLPEELCEFISNLRPASIPLFLHSSEMISHYLSINDYALHKYRTSNNEFKIDCKMLDLKCFDTGEICNKLRIIASNIGLNIHFHFTNNAFVISENMCSQAQIALYHAIGLSDLWQQLVESTI